MKSLEGYRIYTQEDIQKNFPFFGSASRMVDSIRIETNQDGLIGNRAIGLWVVTARVCDDHFAKFTAQLGQGEEEVDIKLMPGHYGPEILGQTLGALAAAKYPEHFAGILPSYRVVEGIPYNEPVFPGDQISACVQLLKERFDKRGRLRAISGVGVIMFNEQLVSGASNIVVALNPLEIGVVGLRRKQAKHRTDPGIEASFANFDEYFANAERTLQRLQNKNLD